MTTQFIPMRGRVPDFGMSSDGRSVAVLDPGGQPMAVVTSQVNPLTGGLELSAGNQLIPQLGHDIAFLGDSRVRYGYQRWYFTATRTGETGGMRMDIQGAGPLTATTAISGPGLVEWSGSTGRLRWTAPGGAPGAWVNFTGPGEYTLPAGEPGAWLRAWWISNNMPASDHSFEVSITGSNRTFLRYDGTPPAVCSALGRHIAPAIGMGAGGAHTQDCVDLLPYYATLSYGPGIDVIRVGTNDISAQSRTIPQTIALAYELFRARLAAGRKLVICGEPARWDTAINIPMPANKLEMLLSLNAAYQDFAIANYEHCRYVDLYSVSADPAYSDGRPVAGIIKDHVHETNSGVLLFAKYIADAIKDIGGRADPPIQMPGGIITPNPLMVGTGGIIGAGASGAAPDTFTVRRVAGSNGTIASSIVGYPEKNGRRIELAIASDGVANTAAIEGTYAVFAGGGVATGDSLEVFADFELVSGAITSAEIFVYLDGTARRGSIFFPAVVGRYASWSIPIEVFGTDIQARAIAYLVVPAGGTAVVRCGGLGIRKSAAGIGI
jgi:hypothetical protein